MRSAIEIIRAIVEVANESQMRLTLEQEEQAKVRLGHVLIEAMAWLDAHDGKAPGVVS